MLPICVSINSSYGLVPLIKNPTRITVNTASLIDNIFTNVINSTVDSGSLCVDISDHLPIFHLSQIECNVHNVSNTQKLSRKITNDGSNALIAELYVTDWSSIYCCSGVNESYELFLSKLLSAFDKHLPYIKRKVKKPLIRKPWITPELLRCIRTKQISFTKFF